MISKQKARDTIDMAMEGYRHKSEYALNKLAKRKLTPAQLKRLVKSCANDIKHIDNLWRGLRDI